MSIVTTSETTSAVSGLPEAELADAVNVAAAPATEAVKKIAAVASTETKSRILSVLLTNERTLKT
jgi:hypothetical protein